MCQDQLPQQKCCEQGPQGVPGVQGPQGLQGVPGEQGIAGQQGIQGIQGLQGIPGKDCDCTGMGGCDRYANLYSLLAQSIGAYASATDTVLLEAQNAVSAGDFDLSAVNSSGEMKFLKHGIYYLQWDLQARLTPPIPEPVPSWSFGFWLNGVLIAGSVSSGFTQSPNDESTHSNGSVIVEVQAGDVLKLRSACSNAVSLNPNAGGSVFPIATATVNIMCQKSLA